MSLKKGFRLNFLCFGGGPVGTSNSLRGGKKRIFQNSKNSPFLFLHLSDAYDQHRFLFHPIVGPKSKMIFLTSSGTWTTRLFCFVGNDVHCDARGLAVLVHGQLGTIEHCLPFPEDAVVGLAVQLPRFQRLMFQVPDQ